MTRRGSRWTPPAAHTIVIGALFAAAIAVAIVLLPGDDERVAMLERDGHELEALQILEKRFAAGDRSQRTLYQLQAFYEQFGDLENARKMLEMLAAYRPRDAQVQRRLAAFYKQTQDADAYIDALRRQIALRYAEGACRELIGLLRQRGAFGEEQAAIQDCRQKGYRRADDIMRLASLHVASGDLAKAVPLLRSADDLRRITSDPDRLRLFATLLEIGQPREALRRAVRWVRGGRNDTLVDRLVDQLVLAGRSDVAMDLMREISVPGDAASLAVAELMLGRNEERAAQAYLRGWLERTRSDAPETARRFVRLALAAGDPETAFKGAQRIGLSRLSQQDLVSLLQGLAVSGRPAETEIVRAMMRGDTLAQYPQLRAPMARSQSRAEALPAGEASRQLEAWRLGLWSRLLAGPGREAELDVAAASAGPAPVIAGPLPRSPLAQSRVLSTLKALRKTSRVKRLKAVRAATQSAATATATAAVAPALLQSGKP